MSLLKAGADSNKVGRDGCTPLALAMLERQKLREQLLQQEEIKLFSNDPVDHQQHITHATGHPQLTFGDDSDFEDDFEPREPRLEKKATIDSIPDPIDQQVYFTDSVHIQVKAANSSMLEEDENRLGAVQPTNKQLARSLKIKPRTVDTYNITIKSLFNYGASISTASEASGKPIGKLMNIDEKWKELSEQIEALYSQEKRNEDNYFKALTTAPTPELREQARKDKEQKDIVLDTRRYELFLDTETQMVIADYYKRKIHDRKYVMFLRFCVFLILLTVLGVFRSTRGVTSAFLLNDTYTNVFQKSADNSLLSPDDIYSYLQNTAAPLFYADSSWTTWNGTAFVQNPRGILLGHNVVLGLPRLRQIRSDLAECDTPDKYNRFGPVCFGDYTGATYGDGFSWKSSADLDGAPMLSRRNRQFPGSGFIYHLPNPRNSTMSDFNATLKYLQDNNWIDLSTRVVFLEFVTLDANDNFFVVGTITFELPTTGGGYDSYYFYVGQLEPYNGNDRRLIGLEIVVMMFIFGHFVSEFQQFMQTKHCGYLRSFANYCDITIILTGLTVFGMHMAIIHISNRTDFTQENEFPRVKLLASVIYARNYVYSILIFASFIKLFDYLRVFNGMYRLILMVQSMALQLKDWFILFCIVVSAFTFSEYVAYGYKYEPLSTILWGFVNRFMGVFQQNLAAEHDQDDRILGTFYNCLFLIVILMMLMNLIIAILTTAYDAAKSQTSVDVAIAQYNELKDEGFTRIQADDKRSTIEELDFQVMSFLARMRLRISDYISLNLLRALHDKKEERRRKKKQRQQEELQGGKGGKSVELLPLPNGQKSSDH